MLGRGQRLPFDVPDDGLGVGRHTLTLLAAIALSVLIHFGILLLCAPIRFGGGLPQLQEPQSAMERIPPLQVSLVPKTAAPPPLEPAAPDPAAAAGLQRGDLILRVNDAETPDWQSMADAIGASNGQPVTLHVLRPLPTASGELQPGLPETGEELRLTLTPKRAMRTTIFGEQENAWLIGISVSGNMRYEDLNFAQAALAGAQQTWGMVELTAESFLKLVQRVVPLDQVGGPIMIAQLVGEQAEQGLAGVLGLAALISINLAILNLLPIPILDGGTALFCLIEMIFRRPVNEKVQEWGMRVGLALLVCLMLLATYNDIARIITG